MTAEQIEAVRVPTFTGKWVNPLRMKVEDLDILDIAHHLSQLCRYNGGTHGFYSVGEHSLFVARQMHHYGADANTVMAGLLHDAAEAYLGDVRSPLKALVPEFRGIERALQMMIFKWAGVDVSGYVLESVEEVDRLIRFNESKYLFPKIPEWTFDHMGVPLATEFKCKAPDMVEREFLNYFGCLARELAAEQIQNKK